MQIVTIWVFRRHHHQAVALVKKVVRAVHQAAVLQKDYPMNHLPIVTWTGLVLVKTKKTNQTAHQSLVIQMEFVLATMKEEAWASHQIRTIWMICQMAYLWVANHTEFAVVRMKGMNRAVHRVDHQVVHQVVHRVAAAVIQMEFVLAHRAAAVVVVAWMDPPVVVVAVVAVVLTVLVTLRVIQIIRKTVKMAFKHP